MVSTRVTPDEYTKLQASRERYLGSGIYGIIFRQEQLDHIEWDGTPDIVVSNQI